MAVLSEQKIQIVRTLVEQAPDPVVGKLQAALAHAGGDEVLARVRQLVDLEADDRRLRNMVLAPIAPLCAGDGKAGDRLQFPGRVLGLVWRGLKGEASEKVAEAGGILRELAGCEDSRGVFDELTQFAAGGLRAGVVREFAAAAEAADAARPGGADLLATCLDLAPVVRLACQRLPDWITRMAEEETAQARVAFKDAVAVRKDAGPLFFEMIAAQLAHPHQVLRIISAVMDAPDEHYFAASESASFALRLMDAVDAELAKIAALDPDAGREAGCAAAQVVERITERLGELDQAVELDRDGPWGRRIAKQRATLVKTVEARLRDLERAVAAALPTKQARTGRLVRNIPRIGHPPEPKACTRALTLLQFASEVRAAANQGGFASSRGKTMDRLAEDLDVYVEDVLDSLRHGEAEDPEAARAYLSVAADFAGLIHDAKAAEVIRRRATAG